MWERKFSWHLHSIKENETNFLQNEINGPQNVLKLKANEMAEPQNERKIKVNEIIFNQNDRTVKENEIKIKANDMTGPQNVRKFEQNEVMALQNDPTASKMTQQQWLCQAAIHVSITVRPFYLPAAPLTKMSNSLTLRHRHFTPQNGVRSIRRVGTKRPP